jgi:hypothetical protein
MAIISCNIIREKINCDFTEDIIICFINNINEIEHKIYHEYDIGHDYSDFYSIENEFFEYLEDVIFDKFNFNENIFIKKYNYLINNIPVELNNIFIEYPELKDNGYKYYIDYMIFLHIIFFESIKDGEINRSDYPFLADADFENINLKNIIKIRSLFSKHDKNIIYSKKKIIINDFE